ncbi:MULTISPECIES: CPBP family intramembrane glutamic endopeptidase [unclassified Nonomuraea]|uniref:CPBP family intramembrane glutamic endopeptidase n=1 Tax=unclassified Nonomuraea TaxID=2593643 RepID=UPI00340CEFB5
MVQTESRTARGVLAPVGVFVAVALVASGVLGTAQAGTPIPPVVIQLTQFGPALAVAVVALLWPRIAREALTGAVGRGDRSAPSGARGRGGGTALSGTRGRAGLAGVALQGTALLIVGLSAGAYGLLTGDARFTAPGALSSPFALIVVAQLVGACAEEIGWRCLLQPLLRRRTGPLTASVVVGLLWGAWHVPVFGRPPLYAAAFLLATVSMSVVMGLALERLRGHRLLLAGGFHTLVNLGLLLFMDEEAGALAPIALFGVTCLLAALLWMWRAPARIHVR